MLSSEQQRGGPIVWRYAYQGDPSLAGIVINEYFAPSGFGFLPDDYNFPAAHPAMVIYYFWDGHIHTFYHAPNGVVLKQFWSKEKATPRSPLWDFVDFKQGSDPQFKTHTDPRRKIVQWRNLHAGDPALAGIVIDQEPPEGCVYNDKSRYDHRHPADVTYYFWDGRVRQMEFEPYGDVIGDFWWREKIKPGDGWWTDVDFSYGTDPKFRTHKDPRIR